MGASLKNIAAIVAFAGFGLSADAGFGATITQLNGPEDLFSRIEGRSKFTQDFEDANLFVADDSVDLADPNDPIAAPLIDFASPVVASTTGGVGGVTSSGARLGINLIQTGGNPLIATFRADLNVFEVGMFFGNDDPFFDANTNDDDPGFTAILTAFDSTGVTLGLVEVSIGRPGDPPLNDFVDTFIGLRSDAPIGMVSLEYVGNFAAEAVDDFFIGLRSVAPVPVPAALPMALGGIALLFALGRRRRA